MKISRRGVERKIILRDKEILACDPDPVLCRLIASARLWQQQLVKGEVDSVDTLATRENMDAGDVSRILPLAFLAPDIIQAILDGRQPMDLTARSLRRIRPLPSD